MFFFIFEKSVDQPCEMWPPFLPEAPNPEVGNAYKSNNYGLPASWQASISEFQNGQFIHNRFPKELVDMFLNCKKQECQKLTSKVTDDEMNSYLNTV